jgi:hypothetical protein
MDSHDISISVVQALLGSHTEEGRGAPAATRARPPGRLPFSIALSREAGALGHGVAAEVGRRLGWPVYDQELLDRIGQELRRPPSHLKAVDEQPGSWLEETLSGLASQCVVSADTYLKYLVGVTRGLGAIGRCVLVGRGANFILPAATTLRVRLVASAEDRARVIAERLHLRAKEAAAWVERTERQRGEFIRRAFRQDVADPHHYDLVLNMSRLSVEEAADAVLQMLRRFEGRGAPAGRTEAPAAAHGGT